MKSLKDDNSIKICSFDKGNGIVIVNSNEYYAKLDEIVYDKSKFEEVRVSPDMSHPIIRNETAIRNYLRKNVKGKISQNEFESMYPTGSQPGKMYGLCKVHKPGLPFRPVVSMLNTAEYKLAKFLDNIIKPHIPSKHMLDSTSSFLDKLKEFVFRQNDILVSFDVVSLFTNVPLGETIDMIAEHIYNSNTKPMFEKDVFKRLMKIATSGIFMYNGKCFKQVDGVTMGSPLGPTMANFCLAYYEEKLLGDSSGNTGDPCLYLRYVDDIFCVFRSGTSHEAFLNKLNSMHNNLKFTVEVGNSSLAFLDTFITLPTEEGETFSSRVFRKATYTGLILNASSICPQKWKFGLAQCLIHRAYAISSNWQIFNQEIDFLKNVFVKNGYTECFFLSCVKKFLKDKFTKISNVKVEDDKVETIFFIPYIGLPSVVFGRKLKELFKKYYCIDVRIVFSTFKVKNYFSLKCQTPLPLMANVVYKFQCLCDTNKAYIGKTMRHLATRVKEHEHSTSAIHDHLVSCETCKSEYSCNSFTIVDTGRNNLDITVKEALHIKDSKPQLNKQLFCQGASFVLNIF